MRTALEAPARSAGGRAFKLVLTLGLAAACGLGAGWLGSRKAESHVAPKEGAVRDELERLRAEVEALKNVRQTSPGALTPAPAPLAVAAPNGEKAVEPSTAEVVPEPHDPASVERRDAERADAAQIRMNVELDAQPRDRAFEHGVEEQLRALYANPEFAGTELQTLDCRTTLCRVTSTHATREAMETFTRKAAEHPPFDTEVFYRSGDGDHPTSTLYVARPGSSLPHDF